MTRELQDPTARDPQEVNLQPKAKGPQSENDMSEGPVREKLKKTSIASMPQYGSTATTQESVDLEACEGEPDAIDAPGPLAESRGRSLRKRSLEDLESANNDEHTSDYPSEDDPNGHIRKRSRDVRACGEAQTDKGRPASMTTSLQEETENEVIEEQSSGLHQVSRDAKHSTKTPPPITTDHNNHITDEALSPRKKRSRDQFETESHREQKIAATDETRARRRSEEEDREIWSTDDQGNREEENNGVLKTSTKPENDASSVSTAKVRHLI